VQKAEQDGWQGIHWEVLWQAREEVVGCLLAPRYAIVDKDKMHLFTSSGTIHSHIT